MKFARNLLVSSAVCLTISFSTAHFGQASAQGACNDKNVIERLPPPPNGCHKERITAVGNQRPTAYWAQKSAEDHWQDEVLNRYGERYGQWRNATCITTECGPSSFAGFTRCTYAGYPCATKVQLDPALSRDEISELQRLLKKHGFWVKVDGLFGEKTHQALQKWQRSKNLTDDGLPSRENLEALRKA